MAIVFTRTRQEIANLALGKLGVKAGGVSAVSADMEIIYEALDLRLKEMHALGIFWRKVTNRPLSFTIPANVASASASVDILFPISMHVVDGSLDEPVEMIGIREYAAIPDKAEAGVPLKALYAGSAEFIFWPVPTASTTAKLVYEKIADDTSSGAAVDVEVSMIRSLKDIIAFDCADHWGKDEVTISRWERAADKSEKRIRNLSAQRVDYATVAVDDFDSAKTSRTKRDWNTG